MARASTRPLVGLEGARTCLGLASKSYGHARDSCKLPVGLKCPDLVTVGQSLRLSAESSSRAHKYGDYHPHLTTAQMGMLPHAAVCRTERPRTTKSCGNQSQRADSRRKNLAGVQPKTSMCVDVTARIQQAAHQFLLRLQAGPGKLLNLNC